MSWQSYVVNLVQKECLTAGIFGFGGEPWHDMNDPSSISASVPEILSLISKIKAGPGIGSLSLGGENFSEVLTVKDEYTLTKRKTDDKERKHLMYAALGKNFVLMATRGGAGERGVMGTVEDLKEYINTNT